VTPEGSLKRVSKSVANWLSKQHRLTSVACQNWATVCGSCVLGIMSIQPTKTTNKNVSPWTHVAKCNGFGLYFLGRCGVGRSKRGGSSRATSRDIVVRNPFVCKLCLIDCERVQDISKRERKRDFKNVHCRVTINWINFQHYPRHCDNMAFQQR
jgi:hypothetical protein